MGVGVGALAGLIVISSLLQKWHDITSWSARVTFCRFHRDTRQFLLAGHSAPKATPDISTKLPTTEMNLVWSRINPYLKQPPTHLHLYP